MKKCCLWLLTLRVLFSCAACGLRNETARTDTSAVPETVSANAEMTDAVREAARRVPASETAEETAAEDTTPAKITVGWATDSAQAVQAEPHVVETGEYATHIYFLSDKTVRDFRVLSVSLADADDGNFTFRSETKLQFDTLAAGEYLTVETVFWGDLPNNGFSYVDTDGTTRYFTVSQSGEDGSLVTEPFTPAAQE